LVDACNSVIGFAPMSQRRLRLDVRAEVRVLPLISRILRVPQLQTGGVAARIVRSRESFRIISWAYHHAGMIRNERRLVAIKSLLPTMR
jgi:hypothetical protein